MTSRNKAILWVAFVFLMGGLFGAALTHLFIHHSLGRSGYSFLPFMHRRPSPQKVVERFSKRLDLDPAQQDELQEILERSRERYQSANKETRRLYRRVRRSTLQENRAILRAEQLQGFEDFVKRHDRRRRRPPKESFHR